jgi:hypothetical protein
LTVAHWPRPKIAGNDALIQAKIAAKKETFELTDSLRPGAWNFVSIVLPAVKPDQFGGVEVQIQTQSARLSLN